MALFTSCESHHRPCIVSFVCTRKLFLGRRLRYFLLVFINIFSGNLFYHHWSSYTEDSYLLRWFGQIMVTALASCCPRIAIAAFIGCRVLLPLDMLHCCFVWMYNCLGLFLLSCQMGVDDNRALEDGICVYSALWQIIMWWMKTAIRL